MVLKVWKPWGFLRTFRSLPGQNYFHSNTKTIFICFHCIDICTDYAKAKAGKIAGTLVPTKAGTANCASSHFIPNHTLAGEKRVFHLRMALMKQ